MNTQRNWSKVVVFVVLALASLSSVALSVPHRDRLTVYFAPTMPVCGANNVSSFEQYEAAIEWAEQGGEQPMSLSVGCVYASSSQTALRAGYAEDSGDRFKQYMAAIEWAEQGGALPVALSVSYDREDWVRFEQYMDAIER